MKRDKIINKILGILYYHLHAVCQWGYDLSEFIPRKEAVILHLRKFDLRLPENSAGFMYCCCETGRSFGSL